MALINFLKFLKTKDQDPDNSFLYSQGMFLKREIANAFNQEREERDVDMVKSLMKRKHDAEEIREIDAKANARRKKAYKNYEEACNIKGKFTVRSCPKIEECFAKNKQKFIPLAVDKSATTLAPVNATTTTSSPITTTKKKGICKSIGLKFLLNNF